MEDYPSRGEIVIGRIKRVNPFSALVGLDEYDGLEGMVHISEVTNKWVKDIRTHVKVGQNVVAKVMRVDLRKGHINLSLKRVRPHEKQEKLKGIKNEQKAEKMLQFAGKDLKASPEAVQAMYNQIKEEFGEVFVVFEKAMDETGKELLIKKGMDKKWVEAIAIVAEKVMEIKEKIIKLEVDITCFDGDGIAIIKKSVSGLDKEISIKYISAPRYILSITSKDAKRADKKLKASIEALDEELKPDGEVVIIN